MAIKTPLKWVGSKARIMPMLRPHLPEGKRLVEPFAGSCAVMMNTDYDEYLIADVNPDLVNLYKAMAYHTDALLNELEILFTAGSLGDEESRAIFYYAVRDAFNLSGGKAGSESVENAARFLYLNRHCFNGLCRYNRRGQFNVPFGKYKKPYFPADEIRAFAEKAKRATFITAHYSETLDLVRDGNDVVYCDPPYWPSRIRRVLFLTCAAGQSKGNQTAAKFCPMKMMAINPTHTQPVHPVPIWGRNQHPHLITVLKRRAHLTMARKRQIQRGRMHIRCLYLMKKKVMETTLRGLRGLRLEPQQHRLLGHMPIRLALAHIITP